MFRFSVEAPPGFRRDNEATRVLRDFELVIRKSGAHPKRHGTSMTFPLLKGRHEAGRGTVIWVELLLVSIGGLFISAFSKKGFDSGTYVLVTGGLAGALGVLAFLRTLWLRGKLAALLDGIGRGRLRA